MGCDLVGLAEIGEMLSLSRQRVDQLARTKRFPEPVSVISAGRIWRRSDVEAWARAEGRLPSQRDPGENADHH